jgi:hypothetical protein
MENIPSRYSIADYNGLIEGKILDIPKCGIKVQREEINSICFPHQKDIIQWALEGGCRAICCSFGLGKSVMQLEIARLCQKHTGRPFLIGLPLGVVQEFKEDAAMLGIPVKYVHDQSEVFQTLEDLKALDATFDDGRQTPQPIYLSNYERIREGKFMPSFFGGCSFDEGDAIRNRETDTTEYIMTEFKQVPFRYLATATPTPNDYTEFLNYMEFLGIMDRSQALTRFFQRNSTKAGDLTLYPHKEEEFWLLVRQFAIFIELPSDLGYSDDGYTLPKLNVFYHEVKVTERGDVIDRDGNLKMFPDASKGLSEAAKEKRQSLDARVNKAVEILSAQPNDHWLLWHDLEDERREIERLLPDVKSVYGSQKQSEKESLLIDFKHGKYPYLATKPVIAGSGCNFQEHCHNAIFIGIGYKFKDFIQAIHRILRFKQKFDVNIHIIFTDAEREVLKTLLQKWQRHNDLVSRMTSIMKLFGLSQVDAISQLKRKIGVERKEVTGKYFKAINNDAVLEAAVMDSNSVGMILTSIPFSDQYEYCEIYNDMGHNNGDKEFFKQMDYLTCNLYRILKPGRVAAIHVKNRIVFSYQNGVGFTSLNDFRGKTVAHFVKHGFFLLGEHVITTDVVQENNQTYRLGWTENSKDGTKMGCGSPEYLLIFRKPPTDTSDAYADEPVAKSKSEYTRARWQLDAHAYWRSSGNRLLDPEELRKMDLSEVYKAWKLYALEHPYDFETHVKICDDLDKFDKLPSTFMAVPTPSNTDLVWDDVSRMHTLNSSQSKRKQEKHVCPLQFDIVDRALIRYSNKGDVVYDPFGGIMTVPFRCIPIERFGVATELNEFYWKDGVKYLQELEYKQTIPTLFDTLKEAV